MLKRLEHVAGRLDEIEGRITNFGMRLSRCPNVEAFLAKSETMARAEQKYGVWLWMVCSPTQTLNDVESLVVEKANYLERQEANLQSIILRRNGLYEKL